MTTASHAPHQTHSAYTAAIHHAADARSASDRNARNRAISATRGQVVILAAHLATFPENDWGQLEHAQRELDSIDPGGHLVIADDEEQIAQCTTCTWTGHATAAAVHEATADHSTARDALRLVAS